MGPVSWTDLCTQSDSRQALHKLPGLLRGLRRLRIRALNSQSAFICYVTVRDSRDSGILAC